MSEYVILLIEEVVCDKCKRLIKQGEVAYLELRDRYPEKILCMECYRKEVRNNVEKVDY